jgi:GNAT superfamily N-acetyltransferase
MIWRNYDPERDKAATRRIWHETGWLEQDKEKEAIMEDWITMGRALVADLQGEAECLVLSAPTELRYLNEDLSGSCVTGVTTSRVARKQGLASRLTAQLIAQDAAEGALFACLGMFEQGFYNHLGFGTGSYAHSLSFDPARINVKAKARPPRRLSVDNAEEMHAARLARYRMHGGCNVLPLAMTKAEMQWASNGFGLGYYDGPGGELTHYIWCTTDNVEDGPYSVAWMAWQTAEQYLELLALLRTFGDQIYLVRMLEVTGIPLQDFLIQPFRHRALTEKGRFENRMRATAYWQLRIHDLAGCLAQTHLDGRTIQFNLRLTDPIERYLDETDRWRGISGEYVVTLGPESKAVAGNSDRLPTLTTTVNAFSRCWLGATSAYGLSITDDFVAPPELITQLDATLRLPGPCPDWDF